MKRETLCWELLGVLLIASHMAAPENVYVDTPSDWRSAMQGCRSQGRHLGVARSRDLAEFSGAANSSVGAWVGGRRQYSRWAWVDNTPLYTQYGCFSDSAVTPKMSAVAQSTQNVYQCLSACGTFSVALKLDVCWCLNGVPDVSLRLNNHSCQSSCTEQIDEMCGDVATYSIYQRDRTPYILGAFPWGLSTGSETSKCGYIDQIKSNNNSFTLLFDECGDTPSSDKRRMCQKCQVTNKQTNKQSCEVGKYPGVVTWQAAKDFCDSQQLIMATAASGNLFVSFTVSSKPFWVGLSIYIVLSWVNGLAIDPKNYDTTLDYVDGNCLAAVTDHAGSLKLQLENCANSKPYFCDVDPPTSSDASMDSSQSVGSTAPSSHTVYYTFSTHLLESIVSTQLTQQEQSSSQTDHTTSSSQIIIYTSTTPLIASTSSPQLAEHESSSSQIPEFVTSSSVLTAFETSSHQIIEDSTSTSRMVSITTTAQSGDYETSSIHSDGTSTSTNAQAETTDNINPTATLSETTYAAPSSSTPVLTSSSSLRMSSVITTDILPSLTASQSPINRSTSSLSSSSFSTTLHITSFKFSQISESRTSQISESRTTQISESRTTQITLTMQPSGTSASTVVQPSIVNTAKQSTYILIESSSTTIDPTSKISSSTMILPTIEKSTMILPPIEPTSKISSSSTMITSTIEQTNIPPSRPTTPVTERTSTLSATIEEALTSLTQTTPPKETTNGVASPTMIIITIGQTKTLSSPTTEPTRGITLSETQTPTTESTITFFTSTTIQQSRIPQSETVLLTRTSTSIITEPTNIPESTLTMQLTNTVAASTHVLPSSRIETTNTLPSPTTKTSPTTTNVFTETATSIIPTETPQTHTKLSQASYSEHSRASQPASSSSTQSQRDYTTQGWTAASEDPIRGSTSHSTGSATAHTAAPVNTQDHSAGAKSDISRSDLLPIYIALGACLAILLVLAAVTVTLLLRKSHRPSPPSSSWRSSSVNSASSTKELVSFKPEPRLRARLASERL